MSRPLHRGGALDADACRKIVDFLVMCDSFNIPLVFLVDVPGFLIGLEGEMRGAPGRIVMMSSIAGKIGNPLMAAYSASKHALNGLSEGLRREMMLFGIEVVIIAPGAVKTPIWGKAEQEDISRYANSPFYPALQKIRAMLPKMDASGLPPETRTDVFVETVRAFLNERR